MGTQKESLQPQETATKSVDFKAVESGDGELSELEYPRAMSMAERDEARKKLASIHAS
jgi:hypothetical protein